MLESPYEEPLFEIYELLYDADVVAASPPVGGQHLDEGGNDDDSGHYGDFW